MAGLPAPWHNACCYFHNRHEYFTQAPGRQGGRVSWRREIKLCFPQKKNIACLQRIWKRFPGNRIYRLTYFAPQARRILGYEPSVWTDLDSWMDGVHPDDRDRVRKDFFCIAMSKSS
ncbi:MAG: hypothetical protein E4H20_06795 [Spirochaetales bacterium]|nr:MAG: hypothetical protein E4H20_06795 [Spirochaetales bacterium]